MPKLLTSEVILIAIVISLWLISVIICLRRYSIFLCFNKRDVPYYNTNLLEDKNKLNQSESHAFVASSSASPLNQEVETINETGAGPGAVVATGGIVRKESQIFCDGQPMTAANLAANQSTSENKEASRSINASRLAKKRNYISFSSLTNLLMNNNGKHSSSRHQFICDKCQNSQYIYYMKQISSTYNTNLNEQLKRDSYTSTITCNNYFDATSDYFQQKQYNNRHLYYNQSQRRHYHYMPVNNSPQLCSCGSRSKQHTCAHKLNARLKKNNSFDYYFSNGYIYPSSMRGSSSLLSNPLASPKLPQHQQSQQLKGPKVLKKMQTITTLNKKHSASSAASTSLLKKKEECQELLPLNISKRVDTDDDELDMDLKKFTQNAALTTKRSIIKSKHLNLMSLDESALNDYREQHKLNKVIQIENKHKNSKFLLPQTNTATSSFSKANAMQMQQNQQHQEENASNQLSEKRLSTHTNSSNKTRYMLYMPHPNFISLRSGGSDSANSTGLVKHAYSSCDYDNSQEMLSSSSPMQSQSLLPPITYSLKLQQGLAQNTKSSSGQLSASQTSNTNSTNVSPISSSRQQSILSTSQRPINPISSLRRHMFITSRRHAHTTIDHQSPYFDESLVNDLSYFGNDMFAASIVSDSNTFLNSDQQSITTVINNPAHNPVHIITNSSPISNTNISIQPVLTQESPLINMNLLAASPSSFVNVANPTSSPDKAVVASKEENDPNLLNPSWIPMIVRRTLLEMHERAVLSRSDSNIKAKYRSSNHLLHSPTSNKQSSTKSKSKPNRRKKPLSLQNSQDRTIFNSVSVNTAAVASNTTNLLNSFYDELKSKLFSSSNKTSTINATPTSPISASTNLSTVQSNSKQSLQNSTSSNTGANNNYQPKESLTIVVNSPSSNSSNTAGSANDKDIMDT
jgi:hypothetical protein